MYDIGQKYGIKTQWLYWRNRMEAETEPAPGEQLKLKGWNFNGVEILPIGTDPHAENETDTEPNENDGFLDEIVPPSAQKITHTVQRGDTLYGIAKKYGVPISKIKELNNLSDNNLEIGQELIIK